MGWRMIAEGKTGIAYNAAYDEWSPARQYSLYHRGVRILTETASARARDADRHSVRLARRRARLRGEDRDVELPGALAGRPLELRRHRRLPGERDVGAAQPGRARPPRVARELRGARRPRARGRSPVDARLGARGVRDPARAARHAGGAAPDLDAAARAGGSAVEHHAGERERHDVSRGLVRGAHVAADGRLREVAARAAEVSRTCASIRAVRRCVRTTSPRRRCRCCSAWRSRASPRRRSRARRRSCRWKSRRSRSPGSATARRGAWGSTAATARRWTRAGRAGCST